MDGDAFFPRGCSLMFLCKIKSNKVTMHGAGFSELL